MSWWKNATVEQKLAQIDGAIECGVNAVVLANSLGISGFVVKLFARQHARFFAMQHSDRVRYGQRGAEVSKIIMARKRGKQEVEADDAFRIFEEAPAERLFDAHQND